MSLLDNAYLDFTPDLRICRILNGLWQVSGAHGTIDPKTAIPQMRDYADAGFSTWDVADHYGPAEDFIGAFGRHMAQRTPPLPFQAFTKWVPSPGPMTRQIVEQAVNTSLRRMGTDRLDLLQFHWWDYSDPRYLDALQHLAVLRDDGRIRHLALTNFDTAHLETIAQHGIRIISNQVQYSLIDRRPEVRMADYCTKNTVWLLAYGTLAGGFLTERYLGKTEPRRAELNTASLRKYKGMIDAWGGWTLLQKVLAVLKTIADKHAVSIATVALRAILDKPAVAGVIVGARLGIAAHIADTVRVFGLRLAADDLARIDAALAGANDVYARIGDCGDEYRR